jgi:rRNA-processing protein FCF1
MEREPLSSETEALWRSLWELWQENEEQDLILDRTVLDELEEDIPQLEGRIKTALAYLQRARYIQYKSGVGDEGLEPILYDVYEPR